MDYKRNDRDFLTKIILYALVALINMVSFIKMYSTDLISYEQYIENVDNCRILLSFDEQQREKRIALYCFFATTVYFTMQVMFSIYYSTR